MEDENVGGNSSPIWTDFGSVKSKLNTFGDAEGEGGKLLVGDEEALVDALLPRLNSIDRACFKVTGRIMSLDAARFMVAAKAERNGRLVGGSEDT